MGPLRKEAQLRRPKRPLSSVRWRLALVAAMLVPLLAPLASYAAATWHSVDAAPSTTNLTDVAVATAVSGSVVIAVGEDGANGVVRRLSGGTWKADTLPADTGPLTEVVFAGAGGHIAYALGPGTLLRLDAADGAAEATWAAVGGLPTGTLTALAISPDGSSGLLGAGDGRIYSFTPGSQTFTPINEVNDQVTPPAGGVSGLASTAPGTGYAVTLGAAPNPRFFAISPSALPQPQTAVEPADGATCGELRGVAAVGSTALAVDAACWWGFEAGTWQRHGPFTAANAVLDDVALSGNGGMAAIAGTAGGQGAVWRRSGVDFVLDGAVAPDALHGVAVVSADDIWAVGAAGTVRHFFQDPPPVVDDDDDDDDGGDGGSTGGTGTGSGSGSGSGESSSPSTPDDLQIVVNDGSGNGESGGDPEYSTTGIQTGNSGSSTANRKPGGRKRLLRNVRVRAVKRGLVVEFDLAAPAKVIVAALRGKKSIGSTKPRVFRKGHGRIVLHYRGTKPPTNLRITARRSTKAGVPARPATGKTQGE